MSHKQSSAASPARPTRDSSEANGAHARSSEAKAKKKNKKGGNQANNDSVGKGINNPKPQGKAQSDRGAKDEFKAFERQINRAGGQIWTAKKIGPSFARHGQKNNHGRSGSNSQNMFPPYLDLMQITAKGGISESNLMPGKIFEGLMRISPKSFEDSFVSTPDGTPDVYIRGIRDRNRSLQDDIVLVEINPISEWNVLHEAIENFLELKGTEEDYRILMESADVNVKTEPGVDESSTPHSKPQAKKQEGSGTDSKASPGRKDRSPDNSQGNTHPDRTKRASPSRESGWNSKQVPTDTPWDTSDIKEDAYANELLHKAMGIDPQGEKEKEPKKSIVTLSDIEDCDDSAYEDDDVDTSIDDQTRRFTELKLSEETENKGDPSDGTTSAKLESTATSSTSNPDQGNGQKDNTPEDQKPLVIDHFVDPDAAASTETDPNAKPIGRLIKRARRGKKSNKKKVQNSNDSRENGANPANDGVETPNQGTPQSAKRHQQRTTKPPLVEYKIESVMKHPNWCNLVQRTGRVVNILEFKHIRKATGTLKLLADKNPSVALFSPTDSRVPRMKVPMTDCPANFYQRSGDYATTLFIGQLAEWETPGLAWGRLLDIIGDSNDVNVRTISIMIDHDIVNNPFSDESIADLPGEEWTIPKSEIASRRDFRSECVFSIDPLTARDLDDALSISKEEDGNYRVAVHIADVSYFIPEQSALDEEAHHRGISTYLVQNVIPMLPRQLCENLCSLNPAQDRLCFSVEWKMSPTGDILSEWFGRSVIRSCAKLAYEHAQSMLDDPDRTDWAEGELPPIEAPYDVKIISEKVNMLHLLALQLRKKRTDAGYLKIDQSKLCFKFNADTGLPIGFDIHENRHSNKLIEEYMLLANMSVAKKIYDAFPQLALLRRHPPPKQDVLKKKEALLSAVGMPVDTTSPGKLAASLAEVSDRHGDKPWVGALLRALLAQPMELAQYFCSGMLAQNKYHHYALNVPFYTHFTSPIRRYADIIVHRLLAYALEGKEPKWASETIQGTAKHCNSRKLQAQKAGEASIELFLALCISQCGPIEELGVVMGVLDHSIDVLIIRMSIVKRVHMDKLDLKSFNMKKNNGINYMDIEWKNNLKSTFGPFAPVFLALLPTEKRFQFLTIIPPPTEPTTNVPNDVITID